MRGTNNHLIPDRSRPGSTTAVTNICAPRGVGGHATWANRRRGGRQSRARKEKYANRKKAKRVDLKVGTLNVGTMTGKSRELADVMERRKVDVLCVQETRWKGEKARCIGEGCKLWYNGSDNKRNGVGIVLRKDLVDRVVEVERTSDRLMTMKLEVDGMLINIVSAYAPQVGCDNEEKEAFWADLEEVVEKIPRDERLVIGADLNAHVGEGNTNDEEAMGKHGFGRRNPEGQIVVDFAKRWELIVSNTMFLKRNKQKVTYSSGGSNTQVDYILVRRGRMKEVWDTKVIMGESVAKQHRLVVSKMVMWTKWRKTTRAEKRTKWWKLREKEIQTQFRQKVLESGVMESEEGYEAVANKIRDTARELLGVALGKRGREDRETWWWNKEVQQAVKEKKEEKRQWDVSRDDESKERYKKAKRKAKRTVAKAKNKAFQDLYKRLETKEGVNEVFRIAKQKNKNGQDVQQVKLVKSKCGEVLVEERRVQQRWREYFEDLLNQENPRERRVTCARKIMKEVEEIAEEEVKTALKKMKKERRGDPITSRWTRGLFWEMLGLGCSQS